MNFERIYSLSRNTKIIWFISGLVGFIICNILFSDYNDLLNATGYSIMAFEFAWDKSTMDTILAAWSAIIPEAIEFMTIDMFYPIFYAFLISGWTIFLTPGKPLTKSLFKIAFISSFIAALFDYIENIFSFLILNNVDSYAEYYVFMVSVSATVKFSLLVLALLLNIILSTIKIKN
jgi:hypothetical protein